MSMHKIATTEMEKEGLILHGLKHGAPSQLSDCFRLGVAWAQKSSTEWVTADIKKPVSEDSLYWVVGSEAFEKPIVAKFIDSKIGCWQKLDGETFSVDGTRWHEIKEPKC